MKQLETTTILFSSQFCESAGIFFLIGSADLCWTFTCAGVSWGEDLTHKTGGWQSGLSRALQLGWCISSPCGFSSSSRLAWTSSHEGLSIPQNIGNKCQCSTTFRVCDCVPLIKTTQMSKPRVSVRGNDSREEKEIICANNYPNIPLLGYRFLGENPPEIALL